MFPGIFLAVWSGLAFAEEAEEARLADRSLSAYVQRQEELEQARLELAVARAECRSRDELFPRCKEVGALKKKVSRAKALLHAYDSVLAPRAPAFALAKAAARVDADIAGGTDPAASEAEFQSARRDQILSAISQIYVTGQGTAQVTAGVDGTDPVGAATAAIGLRVLAPTSRLSIRFSAGTAGDVESNDPRDFGRAVLHTEFEKISLATDGRWTFSTFGGTDPFGSAGTLATAIDLHKLGIHPRVVVGTGTWTLPEVEGEIWAADLYLPLSYEYDFGPLLPGQTLYLNLEVGPTFRAVAGDLAVARRALSDPSRSYGGESDHVIDDTVFGGVELRMAGGLNDVEFYGQATWLRAVSPSDDPWQAVPGLTGWQFVAGVSVYGDLVKIYDRWID